MNFTDELVLGQVSTKTRTCIRWRKNMILLNLVHKFNKIENIKRLQLSQKAYFVEQKWKTKNTSKCTATPFLMSVHSTKIQSHNLAKSHVTCNPLYHLCEFVTNIAIFFLKIFFLTGSLSKSWKIADRKKIVWSFEGKISNTPTLLSLTPILWKSLINCVVCAFLTFMLIKRQRLSHEP